MEPKNLPGRMTLVDGLRGLAALAVILPHSVGFFSSVSPGAAARAMIGLSKWGHHGVDVFFVLSGFVIAHTLGRLRLGPAAVGNFLLRRSIRLDPPYWMAIGLALLVAGLRSWVTHQPAELPTFPALLAHVLYLQDILHVPPINVAFWTLCIEFQFYTAVVLLLALIQRFSSLSQTLSRVIPVAVFAASLVWPARLVSVGHEWLPAHGYLFLAGSAASWALDGHVPKWMGWVTCVAVFAVGATCSDWRALVGATTVSVLWTAGLRGKLYLWLRNKALQYLGRLSYSFYLVHVPVCLTLLGVRVRVAPSSELGGFIFFALAVLMSIAAADLLNRAIEAPCLRLAARLKPQSQPRPIPQSTLHLPS